MFDITKNVREQMSNIVVHGFLSLVAYLIFYIFFESCIPGFGEILALTHIAVGAFFLEAGQNMMKHDIKQWDVFDTLIDWCSWVWWPIIITSSLGT